MTTLCAYGQPLHYASKAEELHVQRLVDLNGPDVVVQVGERAWQVPRHYIALHGLKAAELPELGFPEASPVRLR